MSQVTDHELKAAIQKFHDDLKTEHFKPMLSKLDAILREQRAIRRLIMALTANEQQAVNDLSAAVETLATDLGDVAQAARDAQAKIQAFMDQDVVDAADKAKLQAVIDGMESDVIGGLTPITQRVKDVDAGLKSPASPDAPLHAN